ncbi:MAG: rhombosortase [Lacunisphaera sp.]|nr:rhombosortase [Lacunisphaera sp.]
MKLVRIPFLLFVLPAGLAWIIPAAQCAGLYARTSILHGEWWRLWTGHWVHFSASHLAWNLAVLLGAGACLERRHPGLLLVFTVIAAPLISLTLMLGEPAMQTYGGLSGLATGAVVLLALTELDRDSRDRAWGWGLLILVVAKIAFDATQTSTLFAGFGTQAVRSSVLAHAAGAAAAFGFNFVRRIDPRFVPDQPAPIQTP